MKLEIERKFLVDHDAWRQVGKPEGKRLRQGYISRLDEGSVRVRISDATGYITLKGKARSRLSRPEYEYEIPVDDARELLETFTKNGTEKIRYEIDVSGHTWEVDEFIGDNDGLIVAEIELDSEDEAFAKPPWVTDEVTDDDRYGNSSLAVHPYKNWADKR